MVIVKAPPKKLWRKKKRLQLDHINSNKERVFSFLSFLLVVVYRSEIFTATPGHYPGISLKPLTPKMLKKQHPLCREWRGGCLWLPGDRKQSLEVGLQGGGQATHIPHEICCDLGSLNETLSVEHELLPISLYLLHLVA